MTLARAWRRNLYGGLVTAALVPTALLVALLAAAFAGGLAPLGVLGQALSGPVLPASEPAAGLLAPAHALPPRALVALATVPPAANVSAAPRAAGLRGARAVATPHGAGRSPRSLAGTPPPSAGSSHHTGSTGQGQPPPPPHPTLIDEIVGAGTVITSKLPGPAGPLATGTLEAVGSAADKVLPPGSLSPGSSTLTGPSTLP